MKFVTQMVNGVCPDCSKTTVLISIEHFFKCTRCGSELEQRVNGKISYIPHGKNIVMDIKVPTHNGKT